MFSLRARTSAFLVFLVCLILTGTATFNQSKQNEARIRSELGIVASRNADDIIQRIFRLQYGLRDLSGIVMGANVAGKPDQTGASVSKVFQPSLELNGATGYGFSYRHGRQANADNTTLYIQGLDEASPAALTAIWHSPQGQAAMHAATLREAPTLSEAVGPVGTAGPLMLVRSHPLPDAGSVDTFIFFELPQVMVDLSPHPSLYRLQIDDVTHIGQARHLLRADHATAVTDQSTQWTSTREIFGRRWRFHADLGPEFAASIDLTTPQTVATTGCAISVFLTACLLAAFAYRTKSAAMRMQDKQLASIVQASSDAFITHDADGWILSCNAAASDLLKIPPQQLIGKNWADLLATDWLTSASILQTAIETTIRREDGALIDVSVNTFSLSNLSTEGQLICRTIRDNRAKIAADHAMLDHAQNLQRMVDVRTEESAAAMHHLQTVLDGMPAMIAYADCQLVNRFANQSFANWVGTDKHASIGTTLHSMMGGELISELFPHINAALNGATQSVQRACRRPADDQAQHLEFHFLPDAQDGLVRGFYLVAHDITPLKTSQTKLIEATHQSEVLLETIRCHAIYSVADTSGTIVDVNDEFCRISGYDRHELIGKNHRIINSGAHPPAFWREMWSCISQGQTWHGEVCNRSKSGDLYWVDSIIAPFRSGNGRIDKYISLRTDITARKRAEVRLLTSSEGFLERAGQIAGVGGWELDLATGEMSLTRQSRAIFGIPDHENLSLDGSLSFFLPPYRDQLRRAIFDAIQHHHNWDLELPFVNRQGVQRWVRTLAEVEYIPDTHTPSRLVGAMQDVTAKHETEEALTNAKRIAEAANSAKTEFLANMSHEIRTPLNAVIGMTHVLGEALKQDDQREWVAKIQSASKSLLAILNDVLDLSKIEAGELRIDHAEFSIRGLVADMKALFSTQARTKGLDFSTSIAKDVPDRLIGDSLRIRQVLTNLLGNALKFTSEGSVSLMVGCITRSPDSVQLQFAVMDTGIGMTPESAQTIFDPFTQADASTTRRFGGTGLGLSIVKRLVTLMNGHLGVHSRLQAGSEFWFRLPLAIGSTQTTTADDLSKLQVCIRGADSGTHKTLQTLIEQLGWHLTSEADGEASADMAICVGEQSHASPPIQIQYPDKPDSPWTSLALFNAAQEEVWRHGDDDRRLYLYSHMDALGAQALHPVRILVVDDSDINREVATRLLLAEGAVVDQAANGHDALALLQEHKASYDAVLMDIQMPFMDGMQATQKIRQDLGLTTLPIVALTAGVLASERERAISAGMTDFVSKPLDPVLLLSSLRHHIQQYRGQPLPLVPSKQRAKPVSPAWPALPGIDMAQVIAEFKFDQSGYQRLLNQMVSEFGTQSVNWLVPASPLASPNLMKARLHKLAGTAAVLGASDIAKLAKTTEHALRDTPSVDVSIELAAIFESMTELQDGLRAWIQDGTGPEPEAITSPRELDQHALHALSEALQHHRLDALGLFESLATPLRQVMPPDTYNQLEQAIQSLDFGQAWGLIQSVDLKPVTVG